MKMNALMMVMGVTGLFGCGGAIADATGRQVDAVNEVSVASCDRYKACGEVASGKKYTTYDDCKNDQVATWNSKWPTADCDKRINGTNLKTCISAVEGTSCDNVFDKLNTAYLKCAKSDICKGE